MCFVICMKIVSSDVCMCRADVSAEDGYKKQQADSSTLSSSLKVFYMTALRTNYRRILLADVFMYVE